MSRQRNTLIVRLIISVAMLAGLWAVQPVGVAQAATCTTTGNNGNYSSPDTWSGCNGGYPTSVDAAVINHPVTLNIPGYFGSLTINLNGWINLNGNTMYVYGNFVNNSAAPFSGTGTVFFGPGAAQICSGTTKPDFGNATDADRRRGGHHRCQQWLSRRVRRTLGSLGTSPWAPPAYSLTLPSSRAAR